MSVRAMDWDDGNFTRDLCGADLESAWPREDAAEGVAIRKGRLFVAPQLAILSLARQPALDRRHQRLAEKWLQLSPASNVVGPIGRFEAQRCASKRMTIRLQLDADWKG